MKPQDILDAIAQAIYDKKGSNILALDLRKISTIADYVVIAEGHVDRHIIAMAQAIEDKLQEMGLKPSHVEGMKAGDWIVLDYLDFMVHLFTPGYREKYQLEQLWREATIIDLNIDISSQISVRYGS